MLMLIQMEMALVMVIMLMVIVMKRIMFIKGSSLKEAITLQEMTINTNEKVSTLTYTPKIRLIILVFPSCANLFILGTYPF